MSGSVPGTSVFDLLTKTQPIWWASVPTLADEEGEVWRNLSQVPSSLKQGSHDSILGYLLQSPPTLLDTWSISLMSSALESSMEKEENLTASSTHKQKLLTWYLHLIKYRLCCLCDMMSIHCQLFFLKSHLLWGIIICQLLQESPGVSSRFLLVCWTCQGSPRKQNLYVDTRKWTVTHAK